MSRPRMRPQSSNRTSLVFTALVWGGLLLGAVESPVPAVAAPLAAGSAPSWTELTGAQKQVLTPLQKDWDSLTPDRRQKWLEIANRFPTMEPETQRRVQQRMLDWARMTPEQRGEARLNFQQTKQVPEAQRQAQWEAYQALPAEQRAALAAKAKPAAYPASGAAAAPAANAVSAHKSLRTAPLDVQVQKSNVVQAESGKLPPPKPVGATAVQSNTGATTTLITKPPAVPMHQQAGLPKISASPGMVDRVTLLPQRGPQGAAMPLAAAASSPPPQ